jgi:hypothetical protein
MPKTEGWKDPKRKVVWTVWGFPRMLRLRFAGWCRRNDYTIGEGLEHALKVFLRNAEKQPNETDEH